VVALLDGIRVRALSIPSDKLDASLSEQALVPLRGLTSEGIFRLLACI